MLSDGLEKSYKQKYARQDKERSIEHSTVWSQNKLL